MCVTRAPNVSVRDYYAGKVLKNENFLISFSVPDVSNRAGQAKFISVHIYLGWLIVIFKDQRMVDPWPLDGVRLILVNSAL